MIAPVRSPLASIKRQKVHIMLSILFLVGTFFLSQAVLFEAAVPFFLPVWALTRMRFRKYSLHVFIGGMIGSSLLGIGQAMIHLCEILLLNTFTRFAFPRKVLQFTVAVTILLVQVGWQSVAYWGLMPVNVMLFIAFEVILALFMTFFLFMAFPSTERLLFDRWTVERLSAACVVGAMMLTGMNDFVIAYFSMQPFLIHSMILLAAYVGGLSFSTIVAMIFAVVVGFAELSFTGMMAVYGMTGFFSGVLAKFGKLGIAVGSLAVPSFFLLYDLTLPLDSTYFVSIGIATGLFLVMPLKKLTPLKKVFYPEHDEDAKKRHDWLITRLDEQLYDFQQFTQFLSLLINEKEVGKPDIQRVKQLKMPNICHACFRYKKCWEGDSEEMMALLTEWETTYSMTKKNSRHRVEEKLKYKCIRFTGLIEELEEQATNRLLHGQLQHGRKMLALQLRDMSVHLDKLMVSIKEDLSVYKPVEEEIAKKLNEKGIEYFQLDVLQANPGEREIVFCLPEKKADFETETTVTERLILPIVEELYHEPFKIVKTSVRNEPFPHLRVKVGSAVRFSFDYGVVATSGEESFLAGDAYEVFSIHDGLKAVLLSDGMGKDLQAYRESRKVIRLIRECLDRKMDPETAMHTIHYIMTLNGLDDMYATIDLALIDVQEGRLWSWKAGSMSTYIKRGEEFIRMDSKSVPVGFLPSFSIEATFEPLKSGDVVVMLTDGVFNGEMSLPIQEKALCDIIKKYEQAHPEEIADRIVSELGRRFQSTIDDRTVLVLKMQHIHANWSSFTPTTRVRISS